MESYILMRGCHHTLQLYNNSLGEGPRFIMDRIQAISSKLSRFNTPTECCQRLQFNQHSRLLWELRKRFLSFCIQWIQRRYLLACTTIRKLYSLNWIFNSHAHG